MTQLKINRAGIHVCDITDKTRWIFISLETDCGLIGWGEATLTGQEKEVCALFSHHAQHYLRCGTISPRVTFPEITTLPLAALTSAFDQAEWDIKAKKAGIPLSLLLCDNPTKEIDVYANINRKTLSRSGDEFAENALKARKDGHIAFKLAPFDEVNCHKSNSLPFREAIKLGLERIASVRAAIGEQVRLMVDCHWRFDVASAKQLIELVEPFNLYWLECPVPEIIDNAASIQILKELANNKNMQLAGFEEFIRQEAFDPFIAHGSCNIYMPDAKYAGGVQEMLNIAKVISNAGAKFSPHNPSGPICDAVSAHLCSAVPDAEMLEMQYDETPLFDLLAGESTKIITEGTRQLSDLPGHGVVLKEDVLNQCAIYTEYQSR